VHPSRRVGLVALTLLALPATAALIRPSPVLSQRPTPTAMPTDWRVDYSPSSAGAREVLVPALRFAADGETCAPHVRVQNVGTKASGVVLLRWPEPAPPGVTTAPPGVTTAPPAATPAPPAATPAPCNQRCAPSGVECSGVLKPGGAWTFLGDDVPAGTGSAALYSFADTPFDEIVGDEWLGIDDTVFGLMCETLFFGVRGDCHAYRLFRKMFQEDGPFAGVPMDELTRGGPLAVEVTRECVGHAVDAADEPPFVSRTAAYNGVPYDFDTWAVAPPHVYAYDVPIVHAGGDVAGTMLFVQNGGLACAAVEVAYVPQGDCATARPCATFDVPIGVSRRFDLAACAGRDARGAAWVRSDQPLAVVVDTRLDDALMSYEAAIEGDRPMWGWSGAPTSVANEVAFAPLVYADYDATASPEAS
jgi:hypothetical protein